jgi:two-component system chemotaxis response regulator CheY
MSNILIVEDSTTTRSLIKAVIEDLGDDFDAYEAQTGFEALKLLPSEPFDLIITDINMPDINGLELISFVKSNEAYSHIPMIIVSTERSEEDRKRGISLGADAYITKPFKAEELQGEIKRVLGL